MYFEVKDTSYNQVSDYAVKNDISLDASLKRLIESGWLDAQGCEVEEDNLNTTPDSLEGKLEHLEQAIDKLLQKLETSRL